jgi:hypothetical protein
LEGNVFDILWKVIYKGYQKLYLSNDIKNITLRISKTLPSKRYQKLYLPKDIKNFIFQRISKTLPSKGYQKCYC